MHFTVVLHVIVRVIIIRFFVDFKCWQDHQKYNNDIHYGMMFGVSPAPPPKGRSVPQFSDPCL